ncbi:PP2C family protein-serine/threonine phosphatase [Paenibacillus agaridevorans]|uniref:PP2C family protein-serine/threonine phosphatase n=1 Tax=Paenibacillus agaridevorans TaxID=171404 RepID=UPI001BE477CE|nr:fused response regulator/phosphatase [Paenibacillus agaridevorans]
MSIIIVDDNITNQMIIRAILTKAGYTDTRIASSARELYDLLGLEDDSAPEEPVDLILMDMMMPEIDGLEACRRIQAEEKYRDVPIIFVTAVGDSNKLAEALDAGASDYVMKPINKLELLARMRSALRLKHEKDWHKERDKRIQYELELSKQVQRSVLSGPIRNRSIEIEAAYRPSSELAGDYYAWFRMDASRYGVILLDMMGHGISSSLVCMFISSVLRDMIMRVNDPVEVMQELNRYMGGLYRSDELINYYFTAIFVVVDTDSRSMEYVNAGHPAGVILSGGEVVYMEPTGPAVGLFDNLAIRKVKLAYEPGTDLFLYTDGLLDALEVSDCGMRELAESMSSKKSMELNPEELVESLLAEHGGDKQRDDICLVRAVLH